MSVTFCTITAIDDRDVDSAGDNVPVLDLKQRLAAKRGHTPQFEAVAVISCKTGEILDFEMTSKYCEKCKRHKKLS